MSNIVEIQHGEAMCSSREVAKSFSKEHWYVVRVIEQLLDSVEKIKGKESLTLKFVAQEETYRGQTYRVFWMNRQAFSLLVMRFTGEEALLCQIRFNEAFYAMERRLLLLAENQKSELWLQARQQGKVVRRLETDVIKDFVKYAKAQNSKNADKYYAHITNACYKSLAFLQQKMPNLRDMLDPLELHQLETAEMVAAKSLRKYMDAGEDYHAIYVLVKQDLEKLAELMRTDFFPMQQPKQLIGRV